MSTFKLHFVESFRENLLVSMPSAIKEGKSPAIRFLERNWNDENSGARISIIKPVQVCFNSVRYILFSNCRKPSRVKLFAFEQCSLGSWLMPQTFSALKAPLTL